MKQEKIEMLKEYMKMNIAPILVTGVTSSSFVNPIVIDSSCTKEELNGHFEGENFILPAWYQKTKEGYNPIIIIEDITKINEEEQLKFLELVKYRKIGTCTLNDEFIILFTSPTENIEKLNETLASLIVQI